MKSYSPKLIIKLWQKSQALASTNPKASKQIKELLREIRVSNPQTVKRAQLEILLRGIVKEVVEGMRAMDDPEFSSFIKTLKGLPSDKQREAAYNFITARSERDLNYGDELAVDNSLRSPCCGKPPRGNVDKNNTGVCSRCGQPTNFIRAKKTDEQSGAGAAGGGAGGMSVTANVSPVTTPYAFKKKKEETIQPLGGMEEISAISKPKIGIYPQDFKSVPNYIRIKKSQSPGEYMVAWFVNGKLNDDKTYYTDDLGDAYDTLNAMKPQVDSANGGVALKEMTTTMSGTPGYNIPGCFAKKGGSQKGVEGSEKIGYTLTPIGRDEMERRADKLLESMMRELREGKDQPLTYGEPICRFCSKPMNYAGQLQCKHCGKMQGEPRWSKPATYIPKGKVQESQGFGAKFDAAQRKHDNEEAPSDHNCKEDGHTLGKKKYRTVDGDQEWEAKCTICGKKMSSVD